MPNSLNVAALFVYIKKERSQKWFPGLYCKSKCNSNTVKGDE